MHEVLSSAAKKVIADARTEALARNNSCVEDQHLLLAMVIDASTDAAHALVAAGADINEMRLAASRMLPAALPTPSAGNIRFSRGAQKSFEAALLCSLADKAPNVSSYHILRGMIRDDDTAIAQLLLQLGLDLDALSLPETLEQSEPILNSENTVLHPNQATS